MLNFGFNFGWTNGFLGSLVSAFLPSDLGASLIQWLQGTIAPSSVDDISTNDVDAVYVDSVCYVAEAGSSWAVAELVGTETVTSSEGTSTPSISAGTISFTAGTAWNIVLSNGSIYHCTEASGLKAYDVVNGYNATLTVGAGGEAVAWGTRQSDHHDMAFRGGTLGIGLSASSSITLGNCPSGASSSIDIWQMTTDTGVAQSLYSTIADGANGIVITINADESITANFGTGSLISTAGDWTHGVVHHLAGVIESGGISSRIYLDGVELSTTPSSPTTPTARAGQVGYYTTVGPFFRCRTWSRALSLANAQAMYAGGPSYDAGSTSLIDDVKSWKAYGTVIPNDGTGADGALVACDFYQVPANAALTDDVLSLGLLNPATGIHNGGIYAIQQAQNRDYGSFNGTTSLGVASLTELAVNGDFYYEFAQTIDELTVQGIFSDGDVADTAKGAVAIESTTTGGRYIFRLYGGGGGDAVTITNPDFVLGDPFLIKCWRTGTSFNGSLTNLRTGTVATGNLTTSRAQLTDPDGRLAIGAYWYNGSGLSYALNKTFYLKAGTSAANITHSYDFNGYVSGVLADGVGSNDMTLTDVTVGTTTTPLTLAFGQTLNVPFYSAGGILFDKKTYADYIPQVSFSDNVVFKWTSTSSGLCILTNAVVFDNLTAAEYDNMVTWQGGGSCGAGVLEPLEDVDNEWIVDSNGEVIFPAP